MSAFLAIKSALKIPITIPVPKGIPGEIFIMGSLYEPVNQDHTGGTVNTPGTQCLRARTDQKPLKSFAVYGSRPFLANEAGTASLAVNVLQHVRPTGYGTPPTPYTVPSPTTPINNTADLKCRDVMNPRTCSNRGLFHVRFNLGVSTQVLIRQPLPPHPQSFSTRIHLDNGQTAQWTPTVIPKESPFLLTYLNGTKIFDVEVRYFAKEIVFSHLGVRYTLPLIECAFPGFTALAGMLPEDTGTPPSLPLCGNGSYNFAITVADAGFN
jgi:hypothetical protein